MTSFKDIAKKDPADLEKELREKREALRAFRFGIAGSKVKNMKEGRDLRKDIARILTALKGKKA